MKITKKIIALAMAGVMALSVVPVASPAVVAEAATEITIDSTNNSADFSESVGVGTYELTADSDLKNVTVKAELVTANGNLTATGVNIKTTATALEKKDKVTLVVATAADTLKLTFTHNDSSKGGVGAGKTNFTLTQVKEGDVAIAAKTLATIPVTVKDETALGFTVKSTAAGTPTVDSKVSDGASYYPLTYGGEYTFEVTKHASDNVDWSKKAVDNSSTGYYEFKAESTLLERDSTEAETIKNTTTGNTAKFKVAGAGETKLTVNIYDKEVSDNTRKVKLTKTYLIKVDKKSDNLVSVKYLNPNSTKDSDKYFYVYPAGPTPAVTDGAYASAVQLDLLVNKTATLISSASDGAKVTYKSLNDDIVSVTDSGEITALKKGTATIKAFISETDTSKAEEQAISVIVSEVTTDVITAKYNNSALGDTDTNALNLDLSSSTATNAVKSAQLQVTSAAGNTEFQYVLLASDPKGVVQTNGVAGNANDIASVSNTGLVTAGSKAGSVWVQITTKASADGKIKAGSKFVKVTINSLPEDVITVNPNPIVLDLSNNKTVTVEAKGTAAGATFTYDIVPDATKGENTGIVTKNGATLTAAKVGTSTLVVTENATATTRKTIIKVPVQVGNTALADSDLTAPANVEVVAGSTVEIGAKATNAITYGTPADTNIATVDEKGVVTGLEEGYTTVKVSAVASTSMKAGEKEVTIIVKAAATVAKKSATIKASKTYLKASDLKKKAQKVTIKVTGSTGKVTVKNATSKKLKKYVKISGKKVTIKKGAKKGTYKVKVTVAAKGNYKKTTKTISISVK